MPDKSPFLRIVLIGFMGAGKSAVGRALARRLNASFLDTDAELERRAGKSVPQIFTESGEEAFRLMETTLLRELAADENAPHILATGGGTPLRKENAALLRQIGRIVWLDAPPETIWQRVGRTVASRPLLASASDPQARIAELLAERTPHYAAFADVRVRVQPTPDDSASLILRQLNLQSGPMESHEHTADDCFA